jgi:P-type Ca2+ transporter type 2C
MLSKGIFSLRSQEVYDYLETSPQGLSGEEVISRQALNGKNQLVQAESNPAWKHFLVQVTHPFAILLWIAGGMAWISHEGGLGIAIWVLVIINAWFSFYREYRTEQAMHTLQTIIPHSARVIREGQEVHLSAIELVPGDLLVLAEGDQIPADARVIEAFGLRTSNAALLGESLPARKSSDASLDEGLSELERPNLVFAGTSVVSGTGRAVVYATGMMSQFGRIAHLTQTVKQAPSPLQSELAQFTRRMTMIALGLGLFILVVGYFDIGMGITEAFVLSLGVIVALVPEGLFANVTLSLAMAGQRLAKYGVLVKNLSVIESLANVSVICTDKSGTLTQNQMTVCKVWVAGKQLKVSGIGYTPDGDFFPISDSKSVRSELRLLLSSAVLCNNSQLISPSPNKPSWSSLGATTEVALRVAAMKGKVTETALLPIFPRIHELPFDACRKRMATIHKIEPSIRTCQNAEEYSLNLPYLKPGSEVAFIKGTPREVLGLCTRIYINGTIRTLNTSLRQEILAAQDNYARQALRVLGFAFHPLPSQLERYTNETVETDLVFLGLMAMHDPPRPEITQAVKTCIKAGIRFVMITGDYGLTAEALARKIGIIESAAPRIITGAELELLNPDELQELINHEVIFARMAPEHKMRLVNAFQNKGEVVAVTGDGVNDAPALRKADIGIAMGFSGTDVAREAADIILTDDNFSHLVLAIQEGRALYDNIRKFVTYIFSGNVPEVLPFILTAVFNLPLAMTAVQVLAIDLVTDMLPGLALGIEKPEPGVLERPPLRRNTPLIDRRLIGRSFLWLGLLETLLAYSGFFLVYALADGKFNSLFVHLPGLQDFFYRFQGNSTHVQALAMTVFFAGVVFAQIGNMFTCHSENLQGRPVGWFSNPALFAAGAFSGVTLLGLVYFPPLANLLQHVPMPLVFWLWLSLYPFILFSLDWLRKDIIQRTASKNVTVVHSPRSWFRKRAKESK